MDGHMRKLFKLAVICLAFLVAFPHLARAGVGTSGGGHAVVCDGMKADKLGFVTLLDLYEAQHVFHLELRARLGDLQLELNTLAEQLHIVIGASERIPSPLNGETLFEWWENRVQFIPGMSASTGDYGVMPVIPRGCSIQQIAIYDDTKDIIRVNQDLWESLDDFNKAALIAHELIYHDRRLSDREFSSETSRYLVGRIFSTHVLADSETLVQEFRTSHNGALNQRKRGP
jgi:hypothetical protein